MALDLKTDREEIVAFEREGAVVAASPSISEKIA